MSEFHNQHGGQRMDQLIDAVRTRSLVQGMFDYGAWTLLAAAGVLIMLIVTSRVFMVSLPPRLLLLGGAGVLALFIALILAIVFSPSRLATAIRIDEVLGLKERCSTALLSRNSKDPFAQAAVHDAERTAESVSIRKRFPLKFPRAGGYAITALLLLAITDAYLPRWDLLGREEQKREAAVIERQRTAAEKALRDARAEVLAIPRILQDEKALASARREIEALLNEEIKDPAQAMKVAQNALREAEAARQKIADMQRYANAELQKQAFKPLAEQPDGMLAEVQKLLGEGNFDNAAQKLRQMVNEFSAADPDRKEQMANEMKNLAEQMRKLAEDPNIQERVRKELEKLGANPEQARQMAGEMANAAAGDRDAQRRVRDMAENLARMANDGVLPSPEQMAPFMQKIDQLQGQADLQQRASELAQAGNQLANAMAQQAQQQSGDPQRQQSAQANQQGAPGQQGGNQPQGSQAGQGGQQPQMNQGGQGLADAQQAMEAALAELEAMRQAAEAAQASRGGDGGGESDGNEGDGWASGENEQQGDGGGQGFGQVPSGPNAGGIGAGERPAGSPAPFTVKKEVSPGQTDEKGRLIASWLVKADSVKGESKEQFKEIIMSAQRDQAEDVDQNRIPMRAQKAVRDYFNALEEEAR